MKFDQYQEGVLDASDPSDRRHEQIPLIGIGSHVGALLGAHQLYLRDALSTGASKTLVGRELGEVLRCCAVAASMLHLSLGDIALQNLRKVEGRARSLGMEALPEVPAETPSIEGYQTLAAVTDQQIQDGMDPLSLGVPMLGLAGEAGSLLVQLKKRYRRDSSIADWGQFVAVELGDLLWYASAVATHAQLSLGEVAAADLARAKASRVALAMAEECQDDLPILDSGFPEVERLPRYMVFRFQEATQDGRPTAHMTLVEALPNAFQSGQIHGYLGHKKPQGFELGRSIGDAVDDNSRRRDGYRFHDAIHLGFLAVMGWSPNLRGLLGLKRRSRDDFDRNEDGARAVFAEEGMAALIAKRAEVAHGFKSPRLVGEDLVEIITTVLEDLEVSKMPPWLWRRAISQGWTTMKRLEAERGGYVTVDMDKRLLEYSKFPPATTSAPGTNTFRGDK
jgi:NTP pyrophosphatase (non-canonical NTP hydrolase)